MNLKQSTRLIVFLSVLLSTPNIGSPSGTPVKKRVYGPGIFYEEPHWASDEQALYWTDVEEQKAFRLDTKTGNVTSRYFEYGPVSLIIRVKDYPKLLLISVRAELYLFNWDAEEGDSALRHLSAVDLGLPDNRVNDGKVDAKGRLWFGTVNFTDDENIVIRDQGTLYMLTQYNYASPTVKVRPVSLSNGIAWSSDNTRMYYADSITLKIDVFDFNLAKGEITNRRVFFDFTSNNVPGNPDGMTSDTDNNLWVACNMAGKVIKICMETGKLLDEYKFAANEVTSLMWGGCGLATLYVTVGAMDLNATEIATQTDAGYIIALEGTGSRGYPENQFDFPNADKY